MRLYKNMKKILFLCMLFIMVASPVLAYAEQSGAYEAFIVDQGDFLTKEEEGALLELMKESTEKGNMGILVLESDSNRYSEEQTIIEAKRIYNQSYERQNGTIFVIDLATRYLEIVSFEDNVDKINNYKASVITDNVYRWAVDGKYYECCYNAITQINSLLRGVQIPQSMRIISNVILALILALIINFYLLKFTSRAPKVAQKAWVDAANVSFDMSASSPQYRSRSVLEYDVGSVTAIVKADRIGDKIVHIIAFIFLLLLEIASSGGSGGGHSGGGRSGGSGGSGRSSSGGHRF